MRYLDRKCFNVVKHMSNEMIFSRMSSLAARVDRMKKLSSVESLLEEGI